MVNSTFIVFCLIGLLGCIGNAADTDGTDFVYSFINYEDHNLKIDYVAVSFVIIPSAHDALCSIKYTNISSNKPVIIKKKAIYGKTNEIPLRVRDVLNLVSEASDSVSLAHTTDTRIFVNCDNEIKLIARYSDVYQSFGDISIVPSISNSGKYYFLDYMTSTYAGNGIINILPVSQKEGAIELTITTYQDGIVYLNTDVQFNTSMGSTQYYISRNRNGSYVTVEIVASSDIMISFVIPYASTTDGQFLPCDKDQKNPCSFDYVSFMPVPTTQTCGSILLDVDQRMIVNNFTARLYVTSPNFNCETKQYITIYDDANNFEGVNTIVDIMDPTTISLVDNTQAAVSGYDGLVPAYRFGTISKYPDAVMPHGHFGHYVPSTEEWVNGTTQFYTLSKDCSIEIYTLSSVLPNQIQVDGKKLATGFSQIQMKMLSSQYQQFIVPMKGYGLHTINMTKTYVFYVVCSNVNGIHDAAGYVAGYNRRHRN